MREGQKEAIQQHEKSSVPGAFNLELEEKCGKKQVNGQGKNTATKEKMRCVGGRFSTFRSLPFSSFFSFFAFSSVKVVVFLQTK